MKKIYLVLAGAVAVTATISNLYTPDSLPEYAIPVTVSASTSAGLQEVSAYQPAFSLTEKNTEQNLLAADLTTIHSVAVENQQLPQGASAGDVLTYTVIIKNNATDDAGGVRFTSTLDPNMTLVPGSLKVTPVATDDEYNTIGNVDLDIPEETGLLANDLSPDGTALLITSGPVITTTAGATVTLNQATGAFRYRPYPGFSGEDTFEYTVQSATGLPVTANVTITAKGIAWFINTATNVDPTERDGTLLRPFKSVDGFQNRNDNQPDRPGNNDYIFIYSGNYTGSITLLPGQRLIGQGIDSVFHQLEGLIQPSGTHLLPVTSGLNPVISSTASAAIITGQNNVIRGVDITSTSNTTTKIRGTNFTSLKISEVKLAGNGPALDLNYGNLAADFTEISSVTTSANGIRLTAVSGELNSASGSVSSANASAVLITGVLSNKLRLGMQLLSVSSSGADRGISISNTVGAFTVNGTGATSGSGGTIQNITHRGAEFMNAEGIKLMNMNFTNAGSIQGIAAVPGNNVNCNAAVYANTVTDLALDNITISGTTAEQGINLYETAGFRFENSTITNAGTGINQEQGGIYAVNTTGNVLLKKSSVSNASGRLVYFYNEKPAAVNIVIDESDFLNASNGTGILMEGANTAVMTMKIHNNSRVENFLTSAVAVYANQMADLKVDVLNSEITGDAMSGQGIDLGAGGQNGRILFNINNNTIKSGGYAAVNNYMFENGYLEGAYENNTIEIIGGFKNGIVIDHFGGGNTPGNRGIIKIANNTIDFVNGNGVRVNNGSTFTDRIDLTLENNIIRATSGNQRFVIDAGNANTPESRGVVCLDVAENNLMQISGLSEGLMHVRTGGAAQSQILLTGAADVLSAWNGNHNTPSGTSMGNTSVIKTGIGSVTVTGSCQVPSNPALRVMSESPVADAGSVETPEGNSSGLSGGSAEVKGSPSGTGEQKNNVSGKPAGNARVAQVTAGETITVEGTGSGFTIPGGKEVEIQYSAVINMDIPANTCEVTNVGEVTGTGFDPIETNTVVTAVVSAPAFTLSTLPAITLNPDAGTCSFTQNTPFAISTTGCPAPALTFRVAGSAITFPYLFPEGNTVVEVTASNGVGTDAVSTFTVTGQPLAAPVLSGQPTDQMVCIGADATFTVATEDAGVTFRWQLMGTTEFEDITLTENATAHSASLVLENVQTEDHQRLYRCVVSNPCADEISAVVTLSVNAVTTANLTGTDEVYTNDPEPLLTFSATGGQLPYTFTYTVNGGAQQTVQTAPGNSSVTVAQPTDEAGEFEYVLVTVSDAMGCSFLSASPISATITVEVNLPVTLIEFTASENENTVLLTWQTSFETNSSHFGIERSRDAQHWSALDVVQAQGERRNTFQYHWKDMQPLAGISYYRLKMTDKDGSFEYSPVRSVKREKAGAELVIYPNPVQDRLYLGVDISKVATVEMTDMTGKSIFSKKNPDSTLPMDHLPPGVYLLKIRFNDGTTTTRKVMINR